MCYATRSTFLAILSLLVVFTIGVTYETPADTLEAIPALIRGIVEAQKETRFDRSHFAKYAAASLDIEMGGRNPP